MSAYPSIREFQRLLSTGHNDALLNVLRKLQNLDGPELIVSVLKYQSGSWFGWDLPDIIPSESAG